MGRHGLFGGQTLGSLGLAAGRDHRSGEDPVYYPWSRLKAPFNTSCLSNDLAVLIWAVVHQKLSFFLFVWKFPWGLRDTYLGGGRG